MAKTNRTHTLAGLTLTWWILKTVIVGEVFTPCKHLANARLGLSLLSNSLSSKCHGFNKKKSEVLVDCMISFVQICYLYMQQHPFQHIPNSTGFRSNHWGGTAVY